MILPSFCPLGNANFCPVFVLTMGMKIRCWIFIYWSIHGTAGHPLLLGEHDVWTYVGRLLVVVLGSDLWVLDDVQVGSGHCQWCVPTFVQSNTFSFSFSGASLQHYYIYLNQLKILWPKGIAICNSYSADTPENAPFWFQLDDSRIFYILELEVLVDVGLVYIHRYGYYSVALSRCVRATRDPLTPSSAWSNEIFQLFHSLLYLYNRKV